MSNSRVRVLVVDDSAVVRGLLSQALTADAGIEVVGTAPHGRAALEFLRKTPASVVVLDVEMPEMDGLETLHHLRIEFPQIAVIMASALTVRGGEITIRALALGAVGCIAKPQARNTHESIQQLIRELVPLVKGVGLKKESAPSAAMPPPQLAALRRVPQTPRAVVVGSSTGGPNALCTFLSGLPADFPLPILIVQHMPAMFTPMLARHLAEAGQRPCREAIDQEDVAPGRTYIAPGGYHMELARKNDGVAIRLHQEAPEHFCRPSVNPLFRSASASYGASLLAVMLTGMGDDGIEGTRTLVEAGGYVLAQDEASSVVWGMPGAIARAGLTHEIVPLNDMASAVMRACRLEVRIR